MVNVPGPDATTAVAAALQRMDLVRQIAAADISAQAAGHPDSGLSGLPDNIVALLACEQRERSSTTTAVGSRRAVSSVSAGQSLPRQCVERTVKEPGLNEPLSGVRQVQQTWRPPARKPAASVLEARTAHETAAPCTSAVAQQQWRTLRRKQPTQSTPRQSRCDADSNVHAERAQSSPRSSAAYTSPTEESADGGSSAASSSPEAKEGSDEQVPHHPTAEDAGTGGRDPEEPQAPAQAGGLEVGESPEASEPPASTGSAEADSELREQAGSAMEAEARPDLGHAESPPPGCNQSAALLGLRELMADAAELIDWYPASEEERLAKAALLADQLPVLLGALEDGVVDAVLEDTVAELTRIGIARELLISTPATGAAVDGSTQAPVNASAGADITSFVEQCTRFEDELWERYRCMSMTCGKSKAAEAGT
mmetsp:Transcript_37947/g.109490  ORF Transcript_37947/g.109490 Transcript_37947/m.109490 type:complete len:426 (+) Transcript_37947:180-1457(+)